MYNIIVVFPGNGNYNFDNILFKFNKYNNFFRKNIYLTYKYINLNLIELINNNKFKEYNDFNNQCIIIILFNIIWKILLNIFNKFSKKISNIYLTGYSLGEYSTLIASKSLYLHQVIYLLKCRNNLIKNLNIKNKILNIFIYGINYKIIDKLCTEINKIINNFISISIINSENSCVISGYEISINIILKKIEIYKSYKIVFLKIKYSYHTKLIKSIKNNFSIILNNLNFNISKNIILENINNTYIYSIYDIKKYILKSLYTKVNWKNSMFILNNKNINILVEIGSNFLINFINNDYIKKFSLKNNKDINNFINYF